jgi:hypothetical protein
VVDVNTLEGWSKVVATCGQHQQQRMAAMQSSQTQLAGDWGCLGIITQGLMCIRSQMNKVVVTCRQQQQHRGQQKLLAVVAVNTLKGLERSFCHLRAAAAAGDVSNADL